MKFRRESRDIGLYRRKPQWMAIAAITLLAVAVTPTAAQTFSIQDAEREVAAFGTSYCPGCGPNGEDEYFSNGESLPTTALGLFDEAVTSVGSDAGQQSTVSPYGLSGQGGISIGFTGDNNALSDLLVNFTVQNTGTFQLAGELMIGIDEFETEAHVILSSTTEDVFNMSRNFSGTTTFDDPVLLEAGVLYTLDVSVAGTDFDGDPTGSTWSFSLVPEPGAALTLGALTLAATFRRRRKTA